LAPDIIVMAWQNSGLENVALKYLGQEAGAAKSGPSHMK